MKLTQHNLDIICVYSWVRSQKDSAKKSASEVYGGAFIAGYEGAGDAFEETEKYMETLFPWLKELQNSKEKQEHGLRKGI